MLNYFLPPAIEQEIEECENLLGKPIPQSFRQFLLHANGAVIGIAEGEYVIEDHPFEPITWDTSEAFLIIMATTNLIDFQQECREYYSEDGADFQEFESLIPFCYDAGAGTGEFYVFDISNPISLEYPVLKICLPPTTVSQCTQYYKEANSFFDWIKPIFEEIVNESDSNSSAVMKKYLH